ncbi:hypothetical protein EYR41_008001 [Orbilia oligospora]|uniref:Uncharacterized protein n=1 Tax=Orbilia oligospora TaxID=2813651 RepID=A0A8H2DWP5_ORBOL|nr:hypothetical protein EYR41_008001 [Orbilia oligospora]
MPKKLVRPFLWIFRTLQKSNFLLKGKLIFRKCISLKVRLDNFAIFTSFKARPYAGASNLGKNSLLTCSLVPRNWSIDIINRLWSVTLTAAGDPMKCSCFPPVNRRWGPHYAR